jgi:hypothetical protein
MHIHGKIFGFFLFFLVVPFPPACGSGGDTSSDPLLFQSLEPLELTLTMDLRKVLRDIDEEREQHPARISYLNANGDTVSIPLQIRTRGHFRRNPMNCNFPPLRLNFSDTDVMHTLFEGQDKIKLVTHCRSRGRDYEQNVLKEYLAYRLYSLFTDTSFRVRLAHVHYADSEGKKATLHKMAFLLEPAEQMATRNKLNIIEIKNVRQSQCEPFTTTRLSVFQYMIGNTDWSVSVPHNVELLQENPGDAPVTVPYDFDWSGLVNSPYAKPAENLGIRDVKTRLYRGICREEAELDKVLMEFRHKKEMVFRTLDSIQGFDAKERENVRRYLEAFYSTIENPRSVRNEIYDACRTP